MVKKKDRFKVSILGAGSWGIALASVLHGQSHRICLWEFDSSRCGELSKTRIFKPLKDYRIPSSIKITDSIEEALTGADCLLIAVPAAGVKSTAVKLGKMKNRVPLNIISAVKGFDYESLKRPTEILREELGKKFHLCVLSGPSHAEEVIKKLPTAIVASSANLESARRVQGLFSTDYFRVYTSPDIKGVELGGALKNIIAIASGIISGLGLGDNTRAALITRGNNEIKKLGVKMGARLKTFNGLSGIGDLIVTCFSEHSRNFRFGRYMGMGMSFNQAKKKIQTTVEGIYTVRSCVKLAEKYNVPMPVCGKVYEILYEDKGPAEATEELMTRPLKRESPDTVK